MPERAHLRIAPGPVVSQADREYSALGIIWAAPLLLRFVIIPRCG
jgi:hypothetical protein